jgi:hypothetical protein
VAGFDIQRQAGGTTAQIEIGQHRLAAGLLGRKPGERDRDHGCADAATRPNNRDGFAIRLLGGRGGGCLGLRHRDGERRAQGLCGDRLHQIFGNPRTPERAVEMNIVDLADGDDPCVGQAGFGEAIERYQRLGRAGQIDDDRPR